MVFTATFLSMLSGSRAPKLIQELSKLAKENGKKALGVPVSETAYILCDCASDLNLRLSSTLLLKLVAVHTYQVKHVIMEHKRQTKPLRLKINAVRSDSTLNCKRNPHAYANVFEEDLFNSADIDIFRKDAFEDDSLLGSSLLSSSSDADMAHMCTPAELSMFNAAPDDAFAMNSQKLSSNNCIVEHDDYDIINDFGDGSEFQADMNGVDYSAAHKQRNVKYYHGREQLEDCENMNEQDFDNGYDCDEQYDCPQSDADAVNVKTPPQIKSNLLKLGHKKETKKSTVNSSRLSGQSCRQLWR